MSYIAKNGRLYTSGASEALTLLDDKFSVNKSYPKGDSCIYNDYLWKFTSDKPAGEWNPSVVEQCRIMDFIDDVNGRLTQTADSIQSQIVPTASIEVGVTASKAYSVGDFLVKDGILYKVTKAIAEGDALTVGTNIAMTTVGSELSSISERLSQMSQSEYKVKEYTFQYTKANVWMNYDIEESNAFIDCSSYIETNMTNGKRRLPLGFVDKGYGIYGYISYEHGKKQIVFNSQEKTGTVHAFVRYK